MELRHGILDGKGMPEDWATSVMIPILIGQGDIHNYSMYLVWIWSAFEGP